MAFLPSNVGCRLGTAVVVGSRYRPTPDRPLTPTDLFYINANFGIPDAPRDLRLHVQGLVDRELVLSRADLDDFPTVTREITLECIGNTSDGDLISSAAFTG